MFQRTAVTVGPVEEPVTLAELKQHVRREDDLEDAWMNRAIKAARLAVEKLTTRKLVTQTLVAFIDRFPGIVEGGAWWDGRRVGTPQSEGISSEQSIVLDYLPVQSVSEVSTFNDADVEAVFDATKYRVDVNDPNLPARISLKESTIWPSDLRPTSAVKVTYIAGYGLPSTGLPKPVPEDIKLAIEQIAAHWCINREAVAKTGMSEVPLEFELLLEPYTIKEL